MDKEAVIHVHNGIPPGHKKERIWLSLNKVKNLETITQSEVRQKEKDKYRVHDIVQKVVIKTIPKIKKCKKAKWLFEEALQIAEKKKLKAKEKRKDIPIWMQSSKEQQGG